MSNPEEKTILIIDDDSDIRSSMRIVLKSSGLSVGEAATGGEGLKIAQRIKPDVVIVDLMMETVEVGRGLSSVLAGVGGSAKEKTERLARRSVSYFSDFHNFSC